MQTSVAPSQARKLIYSFVITRNAITVVWAYGSYISLWCQMITGAQCPISVDNDTIYTDNKVDGANMEPTWVLSAPYWRHQPCYQGRWSLAASWWTRSSALRSGLSPVQRQAIIWTFYILSHWQLNRLLQSGDNEFDPCWVRDNLFLFLRGFMCFPVLENHNIYIYIHIYMYIYIYIYRQSQGAQFKIIRHGCWNSHLHSRRVVSCPVPSRPCHWNCVFLHNFCGMKRTCWPTGSSRCCLSLEVPSSIPAWSTVIHRFLCSWLDWICLTTTHVLQDILAVLGSFVGLYAFPSARASQLKYCIGFFLPWCWYLSK